MTVTSSVRVCLLLLMMPGYDARSTGLPITCHAGFYATGQRANVTCNLPADASVRERGITITRFPAGAPKNDHGTDILSCKWEDVAQRRECIVEEEGYTIGSVDNQHLTVRMTSTSAVHTGLYMCFFVPPDGTDSHACKLTVKEGSANSSRPPEPSRCTGSEASSPLWVPVLLGIAAIVVSVALCIVIYKRWSKRNDSVRQDPAQESNVVPMCPVDDSPDTIEGSQTPEEETVPLLTVECSSEETKSSQDWERSPPAPNTEVESILIGFNRLDGHYKDLVEKHLGHEIQASCGRETKIKMLTNSMGSPASGTDVADVLVAHLGSNFLKIQLVQLQDPRTHYAVQMNRIDPKNKRGNSKELFDFIAEKINNYLSSHNLSTQKLHVAVVFPFAFHQGEDLSKALLLKWSKGFHCEDAIGKDVGEMLMHALKEKSIECKLEIRAIVNDAVATLMAAVDKKTECNYKIAVILGNGFNGCYLKDTRSAANGATNNQESSHVFVNTEWGAFGKGDHLEWFKTDFDRKLDRKSENKGEQIVEKMVSRMYIGQLVRRVLKHLKRNKLLFQSVDDKRDVFSEENGFSPDHVSLIESDTEEHHLYTKYVLSQLKVENYTDEDCKVIQYVCSVVSRRAAYLAAAALATLINLMDQPYVEIAVDGALHSFHPRFHRLLQKKTEELVNEGLKFKLIPSHNGSVRGAALMAAASLTASNAK